MSDVPAPRKVIVCFALPDESRAFRQRLPDNVQIVHTGVGDTSKGREHLLAALSNCEAAHTWVISAGYAGALAPGMEVGTLVLGENFSARTQMEIARAALAEIAVQTGTLLTEPKVAETAAEKAQLHADTGAIAVDMETAWIAELCASVGVPLLSLRVISDAANQDFPVPGHVLFNAVKQQPRYVALPLWLALHPWRIGAFAHFVRGLAPARERLAKALDAVIPPV